MRKLMRRREVTWEDPMVSAARALDLSGLDYLRAIAEGAIPPPPIAALLGMGIVDVEPGRVTFSLEVGEHLYNPIGSVHGGVFCVLLDSAMGCAAHSILGRGQAYATLELKANLVKALTVDTPSVVATGQVISSGRRVITASGQITGPDGTLYAHGTTTCIIAEPRLQSVS
ncbi:MAG TPA: PaaI family thioesterase [Streptosporangiaceae bacterium]|nr:PaaI family thioesterase [Streptosporangiaceae bacterium]